MSNSPTSQKYIALLQWAVYLLLLSYWVMVGGVYYYMIKFPVAVLNLALLGTAGLIWLGVRLVQRARLPRTGLEGALVWLGLTQIIATATSVDWRLSLETLAELTAFIVTGLAIVDLIAHGWPEAQLIHGLFFAAGIMCFAGAWEVGSWYSRWWQLGIWIPPVAYRLQGLLSHPNLTAGFLNLIIPLAVVKLLRAPTRLERIGLSLLVTAMAVTLFFTSSRGGWIATIVALGVTLPLYYGRGFPQRFIKWFNAQRSKLNPIQWVLVGISVVVVPLSLGSLLLWQTNKVLHWPLLSSRQGYWGPATQLFLRYWLHGTGPGLFARLWPTLNSVPPVEVVVHAHNVYLMSAVEGGLIGLSGILALVIAYGVGFRRRWLTAPTEQRWLMAAIAGSLASVIIQGGADFLFNSPAFVFVLILIAALGIAPRPSEVAIAPGWPVSFLSLPALASFGIFLFSLWTYYPFAQGLERAAAGKPEIAAIRICTATERDPQFALYWQQCGLAHSRAIPPTDENLSLAISALERAIVLDPTWATNYADLAALYWQTGQSTKALDSMQRATQLAPRSAFFALNLGWFYEQQGKTAPAQAAYQTALDLSTDLNQALFWEQTPLRAEIVSGWVQAHPPDTRDLSSQAQTSFTTQDYSQALELYKQLIATFPIYPEGYIGLARTYWALGDEAQGNWFALEASLIPLVEPRRQVEVNWLQAEAARRAGKPAEALKQGLSYFVQTTDYGFSGVGSWGYPDYARFAYRREGLPVDLVPQLVHADITAEVDLRLNQLADWYLEAGKPETACYILARVYREAPLSTSGARWEEICRSKSEIGN